MKRILLLGASGSIGVQTIDVVLNHPEEYELVGFSVGRQINKAREILEKFDLKYIYVINKEDADVLSKEYPNLCVFSGKEGLEALIDSVEYDLLVNALVGFVGLKPTLQSIEKGKDVALANKETLVAAGGLVNNALKKHHVNLFPIDSEHSAIAQCLKGNEHHEVKNLIITASGGTFRDKKREELVGVTLEQTLKHPNWSMGAKITIDSATMMNKGLEVIEAHYLFDIPYDRIKVLLHKESIIHSMVEYVDNSIMAQLGNADMRLPIQYAMSYPKHIAINTEPLNLAKVGCLHFEDISFERYPLLRLAYEVGAKGGNLPCIMNGANEEANFAFQRGEIEFLDIEKYVFACVEKAQYKDIETVEDVVEADRWARECVLELIRSGN